MAEITEHTGQLDDQPAFWRYAEPVDDGDPVLYVHGVPVDGGDWAPFLARTGGFAPDLPGFGRSSKRGNLAFDIDFYAGWLTRFLDERRVERCRLVVHDWGGAALVAAQRAPERVSRLVVVNAVPLLAGYRWHAIARMWRAPVVGELAMGATTKATLSLLSRRVDRLPGPLPAEVVERAMAHFDQGTQRAILKLYRSAPPAELERAGAQLSRVTCPALVVWGDRDRLLDVDFGRAYAAALPDAQLRVVEGGGHWPWLARPELVDEICDFLLGP